MKIGIDIRNIGKKRTGDEVVFFNLVKNLALLDNTSEYLLFTDTTDTTLLYSNVVKPLGIESKKNFKIISLKCANKFIWNIWTLPRYLRKNPVDVYHTQYITPFFVPRRIKIVTIVHDISFNFYPQYIQWRDLFFLKILIPISLKRADKIIAVSEFTRNEIIKYYKVSPDKVDFVHNAINDSFIRNDFTESELAKIRKKYNLPGKFILYVGTMQPRKNIPFLIEGYNKIKDRIPEIKLVIAGRKGHNFDKKVDEAVKKHALEKDVIFPGFIEEDDKPLLFNMAQVFAFPSLYEGFGIPVLEAMSQKVPVLVSNIPSLKEVARNSALFFDPGDLDGFAEKLYNISMDENLRSKLSDSGKTRVQFFSWERTARKILQIYQKLC
jgi:glycosyltransferase involved in cell wall biosynthesis